MILSRRTLKRMENLGNVCSFDTDKAEAVLNMHFADVSEIVDERMNNDNKIVVKQEALNLLEEGLELIPHEFKVCYNISIDDCGGYDSKTIEEAFVQAREERNYKADIKKSKKYSIMCIFVVLGLAFLLIGNVTARNNLFAWAGLSVSAIIAFVLELMFEVYFEQGVSHFVVSRIYEKFGYNNRFGTININNNLQSERGRKILIIAPFSKSDIEKIKKAVSDDFEIKHFAIEPGMEELKKEISDAEIVVGQPPMELIADAKTNCPRLKFLQITWAGTDMYTEAPVKFPKEQIILANASGVYGMIMSQYVVGMILSLMLNFKDYHNQQQEKVWERRGRVQSLEHAKVLIFGAGDIGGAVAKRLSGFDAYCIGVCQNVSKKRAYFDELCTLDEAENHIGAADVIVGCLPNTNETRGYFNSQRLSLMKKTAVIVNVGRGSFIDCMALDELLRADKIMGAALDVTNPEPLPHNHPLWDNPRCMITPHTSGTTFGQLDKTESLLTELVCENLRRYCNNEELLNRI